MPYKFNSEEIRNLAYKQKDTCDAQGNHRTIVHHIDFNHDNNDPENLIWVSKSEHSSIHAKIIFTGKKLSEEHRKTLSESHKNSEKNKAALKRAHERTAEMRKNGEDVGMQGKTHSNETKSKMRDKRLDYMKDKANRLKCGKHCKGKTWKLIDGKRVWIEKEV